jgi:hypothetical protein
MNEINEPRSRPIGGWLLVLCALLLVWSPVSLGLVASNALPALSVRGFPLAVLLVARIVVAAVGIAAGIALLTRRESAVTMAKTALALSAATDLVVYTTPYFPSNRMPGDTPIYVGVSLAYHVLWLLYLIRSKRVRTTFV